MVKQPRREAEKQPVPAVSGDFIQWAFPFYGFVFLKTIVKKDKTGRESLYFDGLLDCSADNLVCSCGSKMRLNKQQKVTLRHEPFGLTPTYVLIHRNQYICPECGATRLQKIPFKARGFMLTQFFYDFVCSCLSERSLNCKQTALFTALPLDIVEAVNTALMKKLHSATGRGKKKASSGRRHS